MGTRSKGVYKTYSCECLTKEDKYGKQDRVTKTFSCRTKNHGCKTNKVDKSGLVKATPKGKIPSEYRPFKVKKNKYTPKGN